MTATQSLAAVLPDSLVFSLTKAVTHHPSRARLREPQESILRRAERFGFGRRGVGWSLGDGPPVVLVHGWAGSADQMAFLAAGVADRGFRAVVFDAPGHGESRQRTASFGAIASAVSECVEALGQRPAALVGHSTGALCMMAARASHGIEAARYICIAAPRSPYPAVNDMRRAIGNREGVLDRARDWLSESLGSTWIELEGGAAYSFTGTGSLMLIVDETDPIVTAAHAQDLARGWPGSKVIVTTGLGHKKLLWSDKVRHDVAAFIEADVHDPNGAAGPTGWDKGLGVEIG